MNEKAYKIGREAKAGLHGEAGRGPGSCDAFESLLAKVHTNPNRNNMCKAYIAGYDSK